MRTGEVRRNDAQRKGKLFFMFQGEISLLNVPNIL